MITQKHCILLQQNQHSHFNSLDLSFPEGAQEVKPVPEGIALSVSTILVLNYFPS